MLLKLVTSRLGSDDTVGACFNARLTGGGGGQRLTPRIFNIRDSKNKQHHKPPTPPPHKQCVLWGGGGGRFIFLGQK